MEQPVKILFRNAKSILFAVAVTDCSRQRILSLHGAQYPWMSGLEAWSQSRGQFAMASVLVSSTVVWFPP